MEFKIAQKVNLDAILAITDFFDEKNKSDDIKIISERIGSGQLLFCEENEKIVGYVGWFKNYKDNPRQWYLEQITVSADSRGRGIGKRLLNEFLKICHKEKVMKLLGHINKKNTASLNMFIGAKAVISEDEKDSGNYIFEIEL